MLVFANAVGGLSVTKPDTIPSYHLRKEVDEFLWKSCEIDRGKLVLPAKALINSKDILQ